MAHALAFAWLQLIAIVALIVIAIGSDGSPDGAAIFGAALFVGCRVAAGRSMVSRGSTDRKTTGT